jgi:hypothetical protein
MKPRTPTATSYDQGLCLATTVDEAATTTTAAAIRAITARRANTFLAGDDVQNLTCLESEIAAHARTPAAFHSGMINATLRAKNLDAIIAVRWHPPSLNAAGHR